MRTSEQINDLAAALAKAQGEMKNAVFDKVNPHFKNKYATLAAIRDAITPTLTKNGISVIQPTVMGEGVLVVTTRLMHSSGQWIESEYPIINDTNKPQAMGSALTYARRYSLAAICGIASDEDDDANAAQDHGNGKAPAKNGNGKIDMNIHEPIERGAGEPFADIEGVAGRPKFRGNTKGGVPNTAPDEYLFVQAAMRAQRTVQDLDDWGNDPANQAAIAALPAEWVQHARNEFKDRRHDLQRAAA
jgi:hypothetical protein